RQEGSLPESALRRPAAARRRGARRHREPEGDSGRRAHGQPAFEPGPRNHGSVQQAEHGRNQDHSGHAFGDERVIWIPHHPAERRVARRLTSARLICALVLIAFACACGHREPPKRYPLQGQVLAVNLARQELTISHGDIPGLMPAMTMTYPVPSTAMLKDRTPGELITGVLEVDDAVGRLVEIVHTGSAPLPEGANALAVASGVLDVGDAVPDAAFIDQSNHW